MLALMIRKQERKGEDRHCAGRSAVRVDKSSIRSKEARSVQCAIALLQSEETENPTYFTRDTTSSSLGSISSLMARPSFESCNLLV